MMALAVGLYLGAWHVEGRLGSFAKPMEREQATFLYLLISNAVFEIRTWARDIAASAVIPAVTGIYAHLSGDSESATRRKRILACAVAVTAIVYGVMFAYGYWQAVQAAQRA